MPWQAEPLNLRSFSGQEFIIPLPRAYKAVFCNPFPALAPCPLSPDHRGRGKGEQEKMVQSVPKPVLPSQCSQAFWSWWNAAQVPASLFWKAELSVSFLATCSQGRTHPRTPQGSLPHWAWPLLCPGSYQTPLTQRVDKARGAMVEPCCMKPPTGNQRLLPREYWFTRRLHRPWAHGWGLYHS